MKTEINNEKWKFSTFKYRENITVDLGHLSNRLKVIKKSEIKASISCV